MCLTDSIEWNFFKGSVLAALARIEQAVEPAKRPTKIALEIPTRTTKAGAPMPNYELPNDEVDTITIKTQTGGGATVPAPAGDVFNVVSSNPTSLQATIGKDAGGNPAVVLTPLVQVSPGITVTVTDSAGLMQDVQVVDIVADVAPKNIVLDLADATHVSQPVPTAPGP
jgi:hypothetical protein